PDTPPRLPPDPKTAIRRRTWPVERRRPTPATRLPGRRQTRRIARWLPHESPERSPPSDGTSRPASGSCELLHRPRIVFHRSLDDPGNFLARRLLAALAP